MFSFFHLCFLFLLIHTTIFFKSEAELLHVLVNRVVGWDWSTPWYLNKISSNPSYSFSEFPSEYVHMVSFGCVNQLPRTFTFTHIASHAAGLFFRLHTTHESQGSFSQIASQHIPQKSLTQDSCSLCVAFFTDRGRERGFVLNNANKLKLILRNSLFTKAFS